MKKIGLFLGIALLLVACNKNQRAANKLEGKWNVTAFYFTSAGEPESTYNDITEEDRTTTFNFSECKVKNDVNCICEWQTTDYTGYVTDYTWFYSVDDKGKTLKIGDDLNDPEDSEIWTITKISKKELEITRTSSNGNSVRQIMEKI